MEEDIKGNIFGVRAGLQIWKGVKIVITKNGIAYPEDQYCIRHNRIKILYITDYYCPECEAERKRTIPMKGEFY